MMTLKDFVKETLIQIVDGTREFAEERSDTGATTNPRIDMKPKDELWAKNGLMFVGWGDGDGVNYATMVDFNIAVSAEDSEAAKAGGGIRVVSIFSADGQVESQTSNTSVSRVRFQLPLQMR